MLERAKADTSGRRAKADAVPPATPPGMRRLRPRSGHITRRPTPRGCRLLPDFLEESVLGVSNRRSAKYAGFSAHATAHPCRDCAPHDRRRTHFIFLGGVT